MISETSEDVANLIDKNSRQKIFDLYNIILFKWYGKLDDVSFLKRLEEVFEIGNLKSTDLRYESFLDDVYKHTLANSDWNDDWIFTDSRIDLSNCSDSKFIKFIEETIHPAVNDETETAKFIPELSKILNPLGYSLINTSEIGGKKVYSIKKIHLTKNKTGGFQVKIYLLDETYTYWKNIQDRPRSNRYEYPSLLLFKDGWNDFGYSTYYHAKLILNSKDDIIDLGSVKILNTSDTNSEIDSGKNSLSLNFISLGQSIDYYKKLFSLGKIYYETILESLRDISFNTELYQRNKDNEGLAKSLFRFPEAQNAFDEAKLLFGGESANDNFERSLDFTFEYSPSYSITNNAVQFNFKKDILPHRINVIIGKNGSGKTKFLSSLVNNLLDNSRNETSTIPKFNKVMVISYSIFDRYEMIESSVYKYFGLIKPKILNKDNNNDQIDTVSLEEFKGAFLESYKNIHENNRFSEWKNIVSKLIHEVDDNFIQNIEENFSKLSSGQSMLLTMLTNIIAFIKNKSILIIDEPETHLHPNAINDFVIVLNEILETFNSYSVLATHSPIVIQSIPSKRTNVFQRHEDLLMISSLEQESFGANLTEITKEIFGIAEGDVYFKNLITQLKSEGYNKKQILDALNKNLSINTRIFLENIYSSGYDYK
jgi:ABC-type multidrug transport system ATPase subunit